MSDEEQVRDCSVNLIDVANSDASDGRIALAESTSNIQNPPEDQLLETAPVIAETITVDQEKTHSDPIEEESVNSEAEQVSGQTRQENMEQSGEQSSEPSASGLVTGFDGEQRLLTSSKQSDDYMDSREVEEYLEHLKEEQDNYVDEEQVERYLKELSLEKSEQELLEKVSGPAEEIRQGETEITDTCTPEVKEETDLNVIENTQLDIESLENDLEPTINVSKEDKTSEDESDVPKEPSITKLVNCGEYVEEAEYVDLASLEAQPIRGQDQARTDQSEAAYVDLDSLESELQPQIHRKQEQQPIRGQDQPAIDQSEEEVSPPPYSEVDPMAPGKDRIREK